ncbi:MAG: prolipoprotein diacylglyceryl transferase [Anaerolineae bacterium]|nr:prolipoprotein diacylglyceryl transferase [Anaerolineae bacterium]
MNPVIIHLGPFQVTWYGLLIVFGAVLAAWISTIEAKRRGENPEHVWNMLAWILIFGIIGARLYHVFSNPVGGIGWSYYREHPIEIINFWSGGFRGLGIFGALLGGLLAMVLYCWRRHLSLIRWLDIVTPGILLAQAVGRMGNRINQELYGPPTTLPWGFKINPNYPFQAPTEMLGRTQQEILDYIAATRFHPTFYYEAGWNLIGFALVMIFGRRWYKRLLDGDIFLFYLIWYPLGRFLVEMFRPDAWISGFGGLATAQVISLALLVVAVVILVVRHVRNRGAVADEPMDEPAADQTEVPSTDEPQAAEEAPAEVTADAVEQLTGDDQQE